MSDYQDILPLVPFVLPPVISTTRNTKCGRGVIVPVTVAANTQITVTHNLGRKVQGMLALINDGGLALPPKLYFGVAPTSTASQQSIEGDTTMTNCLVWLF